MTDTTGELVARGTEAGVIADLAIASVEPDALQPGTVYAIADSNGRPVGCALASFMDLKEVECLWKGPDLQTAGARR